MVSKANHEQFSGLNIELCNIGSMQFLIFHLSTHPSSPHCKLYNKNDLVLFHKKVPGSNVLRHTNKIGFNSIKVGKESKFLKAALNRLGWPVYKAQDFVFSKILMD